MQNHRQLDNRGDDIKKTFRSGAYFEPKDIKTKVSYLIQSVPFKPVKRMIAIKLIILLLTTFKMVKPGGDGALSVTELTSRIELICERIEQLLITATTSEKVTKAKIAEAIKNFENLKLKSVRKIKPS